MKKIIETERLYLRELTLDDAKELSKVLSDLESMKYYPEPFSQKKVEQWIQWSIENYTNYKHGLWGVILNEREELIGDCEITMQEIDNEIVPEIGFHMIKNYLNKGYATEAAIACRDYAFSTLNQSKIFSYTTIENKASQKVAEKLSMKEFKFFVKNDKRQIPQVILNEVKLYR